MKTRMKTNAKERCHTCGADSILRYPDGTRRCLACECEGAPVSDATREDLDGPDGHDTCRCSMSPQLGAMLVTQVVPRLRALSRNVPKIGSEDDEEIVQDSTLMAARMMVSAERAGQKFSAGNMAYFAAKAARSGRRSYYTGRSDVMSAGCLIDGKARHAFLDDEIEFETGEPGTLHDIIAPFGLCEHEADPGEEAARNLDWQAFLESHPPRHRIAILILSEGGTMREAGKRCGIGDSAALNLKRRIAADLMEFFGEDVIRRLLDGIRPGWESDLRSSRERSHSQEAGTFRPLADATR